MSGSLKISVVTPSFNSASTLRETIESVRRQDYPHVEHIVMDGGSTDGTLAILKEYPHLQWVSEKDEGHFHAMNKGIARASGAVIVILNGDDCFRAGTLRHAAQAFEAHPGWDALFGDTVYVDSEGKKIYQRQEAVYDYGVLLYAVDYICHQTMFVKKSIYERLGSYRHKDFRTATDLEFKLRLGKAGCRVGHVPQFLVNFRYHSSNKSADLKVIRNSAREAREIRREYGNSGGGWGNLLMVVFRAKRQMQKLLRRGTCDLVPGNWRLKAYQQERSEPASGTGLEPR
jgi:glycosyltransferase involved in cell wall biosynthesis